MLNRLRTRLYGSPSGYHDPKTDALWGCPWTSKREGGVYIGDGGVWVYRALDIATVYWEDAEKKLKVGRAMDSLLREIAETTVDTGIKSIMLRRQVHLVSIIWQSPITFHPETSPDLRKYLEETIGSVPAPNKAVFIGVALRPSVASLLPTINSKVDKATDTETDSFDAYAADYARVNLALQRGGATKAPTVEQSRQLEAWYNAGRHPETIITEFKNHVTVADEAEIEMSAIMDFGDNPIWRAPFAEWIDDAQVHAEGAEVVSVRAWIEPHRMSVENMKKGQRAIKDRIVQEVATGNVDAVEDTEALRSAERAEDLVLQQKEPLMADVSIIMARRRGTKAVETFHDYLIKTYGIQAKPLELRQMAALDETLPCSTKRVNPFLQYTNIAMFAWSGIQGFSSLGDPKGVFLGLVDPHGTPCFLDPRGASANDLPPVMLVAGDPGSGKTFTLQVVAMQTAMQGIKTVLINPKPGDSLEPMTYLVDSEVIKLSQIEAQPGYFDPFRFCPRTPEGRRNAASLLYNHIDGVLRNLTGVADGGLTENQLVALGHDLTTAAANGAACGMEAVSAVKDEDARTLILQQMNDPLFAMGIAPKVLSSHRQEKNLRLIEFDRQISVPEKGSNPSTFTRAQRLAMGAVSLITAATLELMQEGEPGQHGGLVIVDEAWMYLQSGAGHQAVQSMGRLGRSKNLMLMLATQRVNDLIQQGMDLENLLSRVLVLKLNEEQEIRAALKLCRLETTPQRVEFVMDSGPKRSEDGTLIRPARGMHRDLMDRHAAVYITPVNEIVQLAISTNPKDRAIQAEVFGKDIHKKEFESSYLEEMFST